MYILYCIENKNLSVPKGIPNTLKNFEKFFDIYNIKCNFNYNGIDEEYEFNNNNCHELKNLDGILKRLNNYNKYIINNDLNYLFFMRMYYIPNFKYILFPHELI